MAPKRVITTVDRFILQGGAGLLVLLVSGGAALEGQRLMAEQELADAEKSLGQDREVCLRLAFGPGADWFSQCMVELNWVRDEERQRLAARSEVLP